MRPLRLELEGARATQATRLFDRTHPGTWRRIVVIEKLGAPRGVVIEPEVHTRIDAELAPYKQACARARKVFSRRV